MVDIRYIMKNKVLYSLRYQVVSNTWKVLEIVRLVPPHVFVENLDDKSFLLPRSEIRKGVRFKTFDLRYGTIHSVGENMLEVKLDDLPHKCTIKASEVHSVLLLDQWTRIQ